MNQDRGRSGKNIDVRQFQKFKIEESQIGEGEQKTQGKKGQKV